VNNIVDLLSNNDFRYEKKYVFSSLNENNFFFHLNKHPFLFEHAYDDRFINNIYFDTPSMTSYWDNVDGLSKRLKVRIRWYGNTYGNIKSPVLEFKIRNNALGNKVSFKLNEIYVDSELTIESIHNQFKQLDLPAPVKEFLLSLRMTLMNGYLRKYYISKDRKYRITYDTNLQFFSMDNYKNFFLKNLKPFNRRILEIKYDECMEDEASQVSNYFPFRMTKSSKYVYGIDKLKL